MKGKQGFQKGHSDFRTPKGIKRIGLALKKRWQNPKYKKKMSDMMKGNKRGLGNKNRLGKTFSKVSKEKMRKSHLGKKQTLEHKMKKAKQGKNHWNWQGGISSIKKRIRECYKYRLWRSDIFTRDDFTCQECNQRGGWIEADHYPKPFYQILKEYNIKTLEEALACEELWNINNGRTLCKKCHNLNKKWKNKNG